MGVIQPDLKGEIQQFIDRLMSEQRPKKWVRDPEKLRGIIEAVVEIVRMVFDALKRRKPLELRVLELERRVEALEEKMGGK